MRMIYKIILPACVICGIAAFVMVFPSVQLLRPQTFLIEMTAKQIAEINRAEAEKIERESNDIQAILDELNQKYPGQLSLFVKDLSNGAYGSVNASEQMISASLYKLYVAYGIYQKIDNSELSLASTTYGAGQNVESCIYNMITISDNTCGYYLGEMVGWSELDAELARIGLSATVTDNYDASGNLIDDKYTSASDVALFIEALYNNQILSTDSTDHFIATLKANTTNTWLPTGMPNGTVFAHKTGDLYDLIHDAGVAYTNRGDYLIVAMSKGWELPETQSPPVMADIGASIWDYFSN